MRNKCMSDWNYAAEFAKKLLTSYAHSFKILKSVQSFFVDTCQGKIGSNVDQNVDIVEKRPWKVFAIRSNEQVIFIK